MVSTNVLASLHISIERIHPPSPAVLHWLTRANRYEIDPFLTLGVCVGVHAMQPGHGVAVEYMENDATKHKGVERLQILCSRFCQAFGLDCQRLSR